MGKEDVLEGRQTYMQEMFIADGFVHDWPKIRQAILPIWQQITGEATLDYQILIPDIEDKPISAHDTWEEAVRMGTAKPDEGTATVYFNRDAKELYYGNLFHELVHLWRHRKGRNTFRELSPQANISLERFWDVIAHIPPEKGNALQLFMEHFYPEVTQSAMDFVTVAQTLDESITEAVSLSSTERFVQYYGLDPNFYLKDKLETLFKCDIPQRYLFLIAGLARNKYNIALTSNYFDHKPMGKILKDLSPYIKKMASSSKLERVIAALNDEVKKFEISLDTRIEPDTYEAAEKFPNFLKDFPIKISQTSRLRSIARGLLMQAYLKRKPNLFIKEAKKVASPSQISDFIVSSLTRPYNIMLTMERSDVNVDELHRDMKFALQLYEYLKKRSPTDAFRIHYIAETLQSVAG